MIPSTSVALFVLFALAAPAIAQGPCPERCRLSRSVVTEDCTATRRLRKRCIVKRCSDGMRTGFICTNANPSPTPTPSPQMRPPGFRRACKNVCHIARSRAIDDCNTRKGVITGCVAWRCPVNADRVEQGWVCTPTDTIVGGDRRVIPDIAGTRLRAMYTWREGSMDLDTATRFGAEEVGFQCRNGDEGDFIRFTGDSQDRAGMETATVLLEQAREAGRWTDVTTVFFHAQWSGTEDMGLARLIVFLERRADLTEVPNSRFAITIDPDAGTGCAKRLMASLLVEKVDEGFAFSLVRND